MVGEDDLTLLLFVSSPRIFLSHNDECSTPSWLFAGENTLGKNHDDVESKRIVIELRLIRIPALHSKYERTTVCSVYKIFHGVQYYRV